MKLFKFKAVPPKAEIAAGIVLLVIMILPVVAAVLIAEYFFPGITDRLTVPNGGRTIGNIEGFFTCILIIIWFLAALYFMRKLTCKFIHVFTVQIDDKFVRVLKDDGEIISGK